MAIQHNVIRRDPLKGYLSGWRRAVKLGLIPPLHMVTGFLGEGGVRG